jgi:hypothetical protein
MATATAVSLCACGSSHFANQTPPATEVSLSVAITDTRVSVSPASIGAGPVSLTIANLSSSAQSLSVAAAGSRGQLVSTSPINPQGTATVSADLNRQGTYVVTANSSGPDASTSAPSAVAAAQVHVGPPRSGGSTLLSP